MLSPCSVSITTGRFLIMPAAMIATWGWLIIGVPIRLPKVPTFVKVNVPPCVSSAFSFPLRAASAKLFTCFVSPVMLSWSAFFITGTIRFPLCKAVAMPILISFLITILSPSTMLLISGNFLMHFTMASMIKGVNVSLAPSRFSKSFFTFSRHKTMFVTSASEKLVTCGLVCLLRTM